MTNRNRTFRGKAPSWANACVGHNGDPGYREYASGFSRAANLILDNVLSHGGQGYAVDEMVYPVCFNMRHSVELRLKLAIYSAQDLEEFRGKRSDLDIERSHELLQLWHAFDNTSEKVDARYRPIKTRIKPIVDDIAEVDPWGQTFRYPFNTESKKHLIELGIVNLANLKKIFASLETDLDSLDYLNDYLYREYSVGSFTQNLSRQDIAALATQLPDRRFWQYKSFDETKNLLAKRFGVSNTELSKAIYLVQETYEFAPEIGISLELMGLREQEVLKIAQQWSFLNRVASERAERGGTVNFASGCEDVLEELKALGEARRAIWEEIKDELTVEKLAGLHALFYFARELDFSENYCWIYKNEWQEAKRAFESGGRYVWVMFFHVLDKPNAVENIVKTLRFLRKESLAADVENELGS